MRITTKKWYHETLLERLPVSTSMGSYLIQIYLTETQGQAYRKRKKAWVSVSRDALHNLLCIRANAKRGRSFAYLETSDLDRYKEFYKSYIQELFKNPKLSESEIIKRCEQVGADVVKTYKAHVESQRSESGAFRALKEDRRSNSVKHKARETKNTDAKAKAMPIMVSTGQLLSSFKFNVRKV